MATLADKLIETIEKDIEELESAQGADSKLLRKECNLIKGRIESLRKIPMSDSDRAPIEQKLDIYESRVEKILGR